MQVFAHYGYESSCYENADSRLTRWESYGGHLTTFVILEVGMNDTLGRSDGPSGIGSLSEVMNMNYDGMRRIRNDYYRLDRG